MKETPEAIRFLQGFAQEMQAVESGTSYYGDRLERALLYCK